MATRTRLSAAELRGIEDRLRAERAQIQEQFADISEGAFSSDQSDGVAESGFDEEFADAGTATFEREKDLSLVNNLQDLTEKIDRALGKIQNGTYGLCDRCGKPIEKARLKALPYATLCVKDKQEEERGR